jgi:hypothetical protein
MDRVTVELTQSLSPDQHLFPLQYATNLDIHQREFNSYILKSRLTDVTDLPASVGSTELTTSLATSNRVATLLEPTSMVGKDFSTGQLIAHPTAAHELVFVEGDVANYQQILASFQPNREVFVLDTAQDGVLQISQILAREQNVSAIHLISHGSTGALQLGQTTLNLNTLNRYANQLQDWSNSLTADADILLYGCDVAGDAWGTSFVQQISQLTGADLAASVNLTGNAALGGDWQLEFATGQIESSTILSLDYAETLGTIRLVDGKLTFKGGFTDDNSLPVLETSDLTLSLIENGTQLLLRDANHALQNFSADQGIVEVEGDNNAIKVDLAKLSAIELVLAKDSKATVSGEEFAASDFAKRQIRFIVDDILRVDPSLLTNPTNTKEQVLLNQSGERTLNFANATAFSSIQVIGRDGKDIITFNGKILGSSISINGQDGEDQVTFAANVWTQGQDASVKAATINVNSNVIFSTRKVAIEEDQVKSQSTGDSGKLSFEGKTITLNTNSALLTHAIEKGKAGDITLSVAENASFDLLDLLANTDQSAVKIQLLDKAKIQGGTVKLTAKADHTQYFTEKSPLRDTVIEFLENIKLGAGVAISKTQAEISLATESNIIASSLSLDATAKSNAQTKAYGYGLGVAYGQTDATAKVIVNTGVKLETAGDLSIESNATSTIKISASPKFAAKDVAAAAIAVSIAKLESTTQIAQGATVKVGGKAKIQALSNEESTTVAEAAAAQNGQLGVAVSVLNSNNNTAALVDGTVTATQDDLTIKAETTTKNETKAVSSVGSSLGGVVQAKVTDEAINKVKGWLGKQSEQADSRSQTQKFGLAASVGVATGTNNTTARIGDAAQVSAKGNLTVTAQITEIPKTTAIAAVNSFNGKVLGVDASKSLGNYRNGKDFAASATVSVSNFTNTAKAYIGEGATVDAGKNLSVESKTIIPYTYQHNPLAIFTDWKGFEGLGSVTPDTLKDESFLKAVGKSVGNNLTALKNGLVDKGKQGAKLNDYLDGSVANSWSQSTVDGGGDYGAAGSVNILNLTNNSTAYIAKNAKINQKQEFRSGTQQIAVQATSEISSVNLSGNVGLNPLAVGGKKAAVGGTYLGINYENNVLAEIQDGVKLYGDSLQVNATTDTKNIAIAAAGGKAGQYGVSGAFSLLKTYNNTLARIDNRAQLTIGSTKIGSTDASLLVNAKDISRIINIAGGVAVGGNVGVGASVSINEIARNTRALIGNFEQATVGEGFLKSAGTIAIDARNDGQIYSFSLAAAVSDGGTSESTNVQETGSADGKSQSAGKYGIGISGDVSLNKLSDTTQAQIQDAKITLTSPQSATSSSSFLEWLGLSGPTPGSPIDLRMSATNSTNALAIAGAVAVSLSDKGSAGLAGSYTQNTLSGDTRTTIDNSTIEFGQPHSKVTLNARTTGDIFAIAAGGSGSAKGFGVAGSVTINDISNPTVAFIRNSTLTQAGDVTINATNDANIFAIAGALSFGGKAGIGASFAKNTISGGTQAYLDLNNSNLTMTGDLALNAQTQSKVFSISAAVGVSAGDSKLAAAVAVSLNSISGLADSHIANITEQIRPRNVSITAIDRNTISAIAGNIGATTGTVGLGGSFAKNSISTDIRAYATSASLKASGGINLSAVSDSRVGVIAAGAAAARTGALGGSFAINSINKNVDARLFRVTGGASESIRVKADDTSTIRSLAGQVAIGFTGAGVGAGAAYNEITSTVRINADQVNLEAGSALQLASNAAATIETLAASGGGGVKAGIAGSLVVNRINNTIQSALRQSTIKATSVSTTANSGNTVKTIAGGVGIGGAAGIGAAVVVNSMQTNTETAIETSTLNLDAMTLEATSQDSVTAKSVSGAASGKAGIAGSVTVNSIKGRTNAKLGSDIEGDTTQVNQSSGSIDRISMRATDNTQVDSVTGGLAGSGVVGIGAGVDVTTVQKPVTALIGSKTQIKINGSVSVDAQSNKAVDSVAVAGGVGGVAGVSGAVSVVNLGTAFLSKNITQENKNGSSTRSTSDSVGRTASEVNELLADSPSEGSRFSISSDFDPNASIPNQREATAYIGNGAMINAGRDILVNAEATSKVKTVTGAVGLGLKLGAGGSVGVANIRNSAEAFVGASTQLTAGNDIQIKANAQVNDPNQTMTALAGAGGLVGLGAAVAVMNGDNWANAYAGDQTTLTAGEGVLITATTSANLNGRGYGATAGAGAGGVVWVDTTLTSTTKTALNYGTKVQAGYFFMSADSSRNSVNSEAKAGAAGGIALAGAIAKADAKSTVSAAIGQSSSVKAQRDLTVQALGSAKVTADAQGSTIGGISVGVSDASASSSPTISVKVGMFTTLEAGRSMLIQALNNHWANSNPNSEALVEAKALPPVNANLIGGVGARATVLVNADTTSLIDYRAKLKAGITLTIQTKSRNLTGGEASSNSDSLLGAVGTTVVESSIRNRTVTETDENVVLASGLAMLVLSSSDNQNPKLLSATGRTSGVFGASANSTIRNTLNNTTKTQLGKRNEVTAGGDLRVEAINEISLNSNIEQRVSANFSGEIVARNLLNVDSNTDQGVGSGTVLRGMNVSLHAIEKQPYLYVRAFAQSPTNRNVADAWIEKANLNTRVNLGNGAKIIASNTTSLVSQSWGAKAIADAFSTRTSNYRIAHAKLELNRNSSIVTESGSEITARDLRVDVWNGGEEYSQKLPENSRLQRGERKRSGQNRRRAWTELRHRLIRT